MNRLDEFLKRLDELNPNGTAEQLDGICGGGQDSIILIQDHPRPFKDVAVVHDLHDAWLMQHLYNNRHYLAAVLRAGRELASYVRGLDLDYLSNNVTLQQIDDKDTLLNNYDRAVEGTQPEVGNDAEG